MHFEQTISPLARPSFIPSPYEWLPVIYYARESCVNILYSKKLLVMIDIVVLEGLSSVSASQLSYMRDLQWICIEEVDAGTSHSVAEIP